MSFDPTSFNPTSHGRGEKPLLPAGVYVFWVRSFKRKNNNGKEQILFICDAVLTADLSRIPKDTFQPIFETATLTAEAAWRFADLCNAIGQKAPFNAMSDRELSAVVKFKPFKAKVKHDTWQGRENAKFDSYLTMNNLDEKAADELLEDRSIEETTGGGGYRGGYDEHQPDNSGSSNHLDSQDFDDDLPF